MRRYVIKKLLLAIPVLLGITIIDYLLMSLAGNPLDMMTGPRVTQEAIAACDLTVRIPMAHAVDSLNVATAGAVALWELRDRGQR